MVKCTKKYVHPNSNFKYGIFQHKDKKIGSIFFLSLITEASMLLLSFYELNIKFEFFY
jgi:hypothetical protein